MTGKHIHKRRVIVYLSFPNNRLSNRLRRKKVVKRQVWKEEESSSYFGVPNSAVFTPFDIPNPTDNAPSFSHTIHYSDAGGYAPAPILGFRAFANSSREIWGGLSPTSNDTDGDGLYDGPNVDYTYTLDRKNHRGENYTTAYLGKDATYTGDPYGIWGDSNNNGMIDAGEPWLQCHPLNPDTDGDSANDGQELFGYDLVWMSIGAGGTVTQHDVKGTKSDPLDRLNIVWYNPNAGIWQDTSAKALPGRDLDTDGIPDYWESTANTTARTDSTHPLFWYCGYDEYWWAPGVQFERHNWSAISNQFNPFVRENIPPMIERVDISTLQKWGWGGCEHAWAIIDVYVTEVAPYTITIGVTDRNSYNTTIGQGGQYMEKHHAMITIKYAEDVLCDYTVNVTLNDTAQNVAYFEKKINGWFGGALDFLADIWNAMAGCFQAAWEAVKSAMSFLGAMIEEIIMSAIDTILSSIESLIHNTMNNLKLWISDIIGNSASDSDSNNQLFGSSDGSTSDSSDFGKAMALYAIIAGIVTLIMALLYALEIVEIAIKVIMAVFTGGAGNAAAEIFITLIKPAIISAVIGATLAGIVGSVGNILKPDEETISEPFSKAGDVVTGVASMFAIIFELMEWRLLQNRGNPVGSAKIGVAIELIGLMILILGSEEGTLLLATDIVGLSFVLFGAYIFVKDYQKNPLSKIAGYTTLLETILTGVSIAGSFIEIAEHAINGRWSDG